MIFLDRIRATYHENNQILPVLNDVTITADDGEFVALLGPSGSGKSTLLKIAAGLLTPDEGRVIVDEQDVTGRSRLVGYMPQKDLLLPWKTLAENAALPLLAAGKTKKEAMQKTDELLTLFNLEEFAGYYPNQLSGGMRQRGALLRTVLTDSSLLLLDEPFASLDALTRVSLQNWLLAMWNRFKRTVLLVTHSIDEAIYLADRIYVITQRPGELALEEKVSLPRPRNAKTLADPEFINYKNSIIMALEEYGDAMI